MTSPLTVRADASVAALAHQVAASLPLSYALVETHAEVRVIDGRRDWAATALSAVDAGITRMVVVEPGPTDTVRLRGLVETSAQIVLDEPFVGDPAIPALREALDSELDRIDVLLLHGEDGRPLDRTLLTQLRLVGALGVEVREIGDVLRGTAAALTTTRGVRAGRDVLVRALSSTSSALPPHHIVRGYGPDRLLEVRLSDADTARPALAELTTPEAMRTLPTLYESAHRSAWRRLRDGDGDDLAGFAETLELAARIRAMG